MRWALVDVETTGLHVVHDRIIEIAVLIIDDRGLVHSWHQLINPERSVPAAISTLTGITNDMVGCALPFEAHANSLFDLLRDCVLVAHNARFDFGFLKNSFKRAGLTYKTPVLCTIKLIKKLVPGLPHYQLAFLAQHFNIQNPPSHRAVGDVETLCALVNHLFVLFSKAQVIEIARTLYQKSSIPAKLTTDINAFPNTPGIYLFYAQKATTPIYIGKSITLRQRILSHFQADYTHPKEFAMAQQVERVEIIPTAGELSALLLESELIKEQMPIFNRRLRRAKLSVGFKVKDLNGYATLSIERYALEDESDFKPIDIYGTFKSLTNAKRALVALVKEHALCPKLSHLEQSTSACFSYQLKRCFGACIKEEAPESYNKRVYEALKAYQDIIWPYSGAIAIKEHCPVNQLTQFLIFHQWRFLGSISHESQLKHWNELPVKKAFYHYDAYKIVLSFIKNKSNKEIIDLHDLR